MGICHTRQRQLPNCHYWAKHCGLPWPTNIQATHWATHWTQSLIHGRPTIGRWSSGRISSCWWWWGIIVASGIVSLQVIAALLEIVIHLTERCWGGGNHTSHGTYLMLSCILSITYSHPCGCSRVHNLYILSPQIRVKWILLAKEIFKFKSWPQPLVADNLI